MTESQVVEYDAFLVESGLLLPSVQGRRSEEPNQFAEAAEEFLKRQAESPSDPIVGEVTAQAKSDAKKAVKSGPSNPTSQSRKTDASKK